MFRNFLITFYFIFSYLLIGCSNEVNDLSQLKISKDILILEKPSVSGVPTSSQVTMQWTAASGGVAPYKYSLQRSDSYGGPYVNITAADCVGTLNLSCTDNTVAAGSTYYYQVYAIDSSSLLSINSASSDAVDIPSILLTSPGQPAISGAATSSQVSIQWSPATGGTSPYSYTLQRSTVSGGPYSDVLVAACVGTSNLSCTDNTVSAGTTYYYQVYATDATSTQSANSLPSAAINIPSVFLSTVFPPTVNGVATSSQVTMQWTTATGGTSPYVYTLQRSTLSGGPYINVLVAACLGTSNLSCTDNTVVAGTTYYYEVFATDAASTQSANSSASVAVIIPNAALTSPGQPTISGSATNSQVTMQWTAATGGTSPYNYTLERATSSGGPYSSVLVASCVGTSNLSCTDNTVVAGTTYYYRVFATDATSTQSANSLVSSAVNIPNTSLTSPGQPTISGSATSSQVTMQWTAATGGTSPYNYTLERATSSGGPYSSVLVASCVGTSNLSCTDNTVVAGTTYYYRVFATDATSTQSANSPDSGAVTIPYTLLVAPGQPTISGSATSSQVTMQWTAASGGASPYNYTLQRATLSGGPYFNVLVASCLGTSNLSCTDNSVVAGTTYYYQVFATDATSTQSANSLASAAVIIPNAPLTSPGQPTISGSATSSQVTMQWTAATGGASPYTYTLQRSITSTGPFANVSAAACLGTSNLSCTDNTVFAGTTYYYQVYATDSSSSQSANSIASAKIDIPLTYNKLYTIASVALDSNTPPTMKPGRSVCDLNTSIPCTSTYVTLGFSNNYTLPGLVTGGIFVNYLYAYIVAKQQVRLCTLNTSTGAISGCINTGDASFVNTTGIFVTNNYAYISDASLPAVKKCTVNSSDGSLSGCVSTGDITFSEPEGVFVINSYAYIADNGNGIIKCTVNSGDGSFSGCISTGDVSFSNADGVFIANNYGYVTDGTGGVFKCAVNGSDGTFSGCVNTGDVTITAPYSITVSNSYAYISKLGYAGVYVCSVDGVNGALSGCVTWDFNSTSFQYESPLFIRTAVY